MNWNWTKLENWYGTLHYQGYTTSTIYDKQNS